ncbi:DUF2927 domain-containing protein [Litorisediminicola beolgyonensis]|uniref:DUF2927 domain-containing protein n=1 Tax=Litorisediminicola beolgyonensis TaxID=1173614 RepID=A0ABW3ZET1_9RHOB
MARLGIKALAALALGALLIGCAPGLPPAPPDTKPQARPNRPAAPVRAPEPPPAPSAESLELARYYTRLETDLVAQGLLRTDGGGVDTPFTATQLVRDFERIALADEYESGAGLRPASGALGRVKKWTQPIRFDTEFGPAVPAEKRTRDRAALERYVARLARVTGHPMSFSAANPNFHVLFMSEDDRARLTSRIKSLVPGIDPATLAVLNRLPRSIHCLVIAFPERQGGYSYGKAIALIRSEHPELLTKTCIHEEIAQGLGLANDSPAARPSIFNDDDEFALLTTHDELLLRMLYDARLSPGMDADEVRPIIREIAVELTEPDLATAGPS